MLSQGNIAYTVESCSPRLRHAAGRAGRHAARLLPAHGPHRRADGEPLRGDDQRLHASRAAPTRPWWRRTPRAVHPEIMFGVPAGVGEDRRRRERRTGRRPGEEAEVRRGRRRRAGDQGGRAGRHGHRGAAGHVGVPRRRRLQHRCARPSGSTRCEIAGDRRRAHPARDDRVVPRPRRAPQRDLGHERDHGAGDVGRLRDPKPGAVGAGVLGHRGPPRPRTARCFSGAATSSRAT